VVVPARKLCALPENVPFEVGAVVTDAVAAPFHALVDVARLRAGESVAVVGVGGLGLHAAQIARLMDASPVIAIDPRASQRTCAAERGADLVLGGSPGTEESVREATGGPGVDVAAEFVGGAGSIGRAAGLARVGGRLVVAGLGAAPPIVFVRQEMAVLGSYGFTVATIRRVLRMVADGRLDLSGSITHRLPLEEAGKALRTLYEKIDDPRRMVVLP
jgi:threonine dehydrogenase-like Zn-dependent dehydrogenase